MKQRRGYMALAAILLVCLLAAGCSGTGERTPIDREEDAPPESVVQQENPPAAEESIPQEPGSPPAEASKEEGDPSPMPTLQMAEPEGAYWVLGTCPWEEGWLCLYEEETVDDWSGDPLYLLRWQTFDGEGRWTGSGDSQRENFIPLHGREMHLYAPGEGIAVPPSGEVTSPLQRPPEEGTVMLAVETPLGGSHDPVQTEESYLQEIVIAIDDRRVEAVTQGIQDGRRYRVDDWYPLAVVEEEGEPVRLELGTWSSYQEGDQHYLRFRSGWESRSPTRLTCQDPGVLGYLDRLSHPQRGEDPARFPGELAVDLTMGRVEITTPKVTVTVSLAEGSCREERHYTADMLQTLVAQSPSGDWEIWTAGEQEHFESAGSRDYVSVGRDGTIRFLYRGSDMDSLDFLGETIVADSLTALTFYDPATGQPGAVQPDFDYGEMELPYGSQTVTRPRYMSIGMAVDREEERIFLAYRLNTNGNHQLEVDGQILTQLPVRLAVIGADGRVLADLDTGMEVPPYGKFVFIPVEVQPEGERVAIRCPQEDKSVQVELPA